MILNKSMSLVVVASAVPLRAAAVPFASVAANWPIIVNLLAGSLLDKRCRARYSRNHCTRPIFQQLVPAAYMARPGD